MAKFVTSEAKPETNKDKSGANRKAPADAQSDRQGRCCASGACSHRDDGSADTDMDSSDSES